MKKNYICNDCDKIYLNYKSLWAHNKKYHNGVKSVVQEEKNTIEYGCRKCDKNYKHRQTRCFHETTCIGTKQSSIEFEVEKKICSFILNTAEINENKRKTLINIMNRVLNEIYQSWNVEYIHTNNFNYEEYKKIIKTLNKGSKHIFERENMDSVPALKP